MKIPLKHTLTSCVIALGVSLPSAANTFEIVLQPSSLLNKANDYLQVGDTEKAKLALERALETNLTDRQLANAHNSLCVAHIKEESWAIAMDHCDTAIKIVPTNWRFHNNLGNVQFGMGNYGKALRSYNKGLKIAPRSTTLATNIEMLESYVQARGIELSEQGPT